MRTGEEVEREGAIFFFLFINIRRTRAANSTMHHMMTVHHTTTGPGKSIPTQPIPRKYDSTRHGTTSKHNKLVVPCSLHLPSSSYNHEWRAFSRSTTNKKGLELPRFHLTFSRFDPAPAVFVPPMKVRAS